MQNLTETNPNPCKIHTLPIRNPTKSIQNPSETQQNHGESIRYISWSQAKGSKNLLLECWPPQKKSILFYLGEIYYCAANIIVTTSPPFVRCIVVWCIVMWCIMKWCNYCCVMYCCAMYCYVMSCHHFTALRQMYCCVMYCYVLYCCVMYCYVMCCYVMYSLTILFVRNSEDCFPTSCDHCHIIFSIDNHHRISI